MKESVFGGIYKKNHLGCHVRVTDAVVQYINPESVFYFTLRHTDNDKCDIILVSNLVSNLEEIPVYKGLDLILVKKRDDYF